MTLRILCMIVALVLAGCNRDGSDSDHAAARCAQQRCDGGLLRHERARAPRAQGADHHGKSRIDPYWFTSARDAVAFTLMPDQPRDIRAIYVSDMARAPSWEEPGATNWIDAKKAFFVIESRKQGGMGAAEAVPFGNRAAADAFAAANGGKVVTFAEIPSGYVLGSDSAAGDQTGHERPGVRVQLTRLPMAPANLTRRRMIAIAAATAGSALLCGGRRVWAGEPVRWRGSALGAQASIDIFHPDREEAERIVQICLAEVRRLERQFSLYRRGFRHLRPEPERHPGRSGAPTWSRCSRPRCSSPTLPTARSIPPSSRSGSSTPDTSRRKSRIPTVRRPRGWRRRWRRWAAAACA